MWFKFCFKFSGLVYLIDCSCDAGRRLFSNRQSFNRLPILVQLRLDQHLILLLCLSLDCLTCQRVDLVFEESARFRNLTRILPPQTRLVANAAQTRHENCQGSQPEDKIEQSCGLLLQLSLTCIVFVGVVSARFAMV